MTRKTRIVLFTVLSLLIMAFIYGNSIPSIPESRETSLSIAALLRPLLDPKHRLDDEVYHILVRKLAHFVEYGALGTSLTALAAQFEWKKWHLPVAPMVVSVLVALSDEGLQYFTGRGNSMKDVGIDSCGALCGMLFVLAVIWLIKQRKQVGGRTHVPFYQ